MRAIADRTGTYRPDTRPARITISEDAADPRANPLGIIDCVVTLYRFAHGRWHKVVGQVWWDEIAPIWRDEEGIAYLHSGTPWPGRPRGQIIKCAEAAALRAGWPENLANVYAEDEMDRARSTTAPSDIAEDSKKARLLEQALPKGSILADLWDDKGLAAIPIDKFHDRVSELIQSYTKAGRVEELLVWRTQHRIALRTFFAHDKNAALDLKRQLEDIEARSGTKVREAADGI